MEEKRTNVINIEDLDSKIVYAMLKYVYSGEVQDLTSWTFKGLLLAADKYEMDVLKLKCESALCKAICSDTVIDLLLLADLCNAKSLRLLALKFIAQNLISIMKLD